MSDSLTVAAIQLSSGNDVERNLDDAGALVREAARKGASTILLPENFAYLGAETGKRRIAEALGDVNAPIQRALGALARETGATLIAGGMPEQSDDPDRPFNTCAVVAPNGEILAVYRKLHLFDVHLPDGTKLTESAASSAGDRVVTVDVGGFRLGLSICYDLRFPELYRALVDRGADALVVPAAFTLQTGKDHWHPLLRARAIESQCWVIASGQWGKHADGRSTYGHSMIIDPWGTVVAECSDRVGFVVATLDKAYLERVRASLPSLKHRRRFD
jgi:predicted amidohydrolase